MSAEVTDFHRLPAPGFSIFGTGNLIMKPGFLIFLIPLLPFLNGCTTTRFLEHNQHSYSEVNKEISGRKAIITLNTGETLQVQAIFIALDSTSWFQSNSASRQAVSTSAVKEITLKDSGKGALQGFGIGALIGGIIGGVLGGIVGNGFCETYEGNDCVGETMAGAAVLGGIGAFGTGLVLGAPVGAAVGSKQIFVLSSPVDSSLVLICGKQQKWHHQFRGQLYNF